MSYKALYDIAKAMPESTKWRDLPGMAENELDGLTRLNAGDFGGGLLGMFIKSRMPDSLSVDQSGIGWKPNPNSSYRLDYKPGDIKLKGSWRF